MLKVNKKRHWIKQGMAFLLAVLMILNQNVLVRAEEEGGDSNTESIACLYNETFDGMALPTGFSGKGTIDTDNKTLKVNVAGDTDISITPVEGITTYTVEFDIMRVDTYDESTNKFMQFKLYDKTGGELALFTTGGNNLKIKYLEGTSTRYRDLSTGSTKYTIAQNQWANYKFEIDLTAKTIELTVTDHAGNVFTDKDTTNSAFYGSGDELGKIQFKIPSVSSGADYSVDNFKVYYTANASSDDESGDGTGDSGTGETTDTIAPDIVDIPTDATKILREEFKETTQPSAFTGAFMLDIENQQLNISGTVGAGTAAKVAFGKVDGVEAYI